MRGVEHVDRETINKTEISFGANTLNKSFIIDDSLLKDAPEILKDEVNITKNFRTLLKIKLSKCAKSREQIYLRSVIKDVE